MLKTERTATLADNMIGAAQALKAHARILRNQAKIAAHDDALRPRAG
jgi:hypothetical protein